jgi:type IV secretory pathway VirB10-like protein
VTVTQQPPTDQATTCPDCGNPVDRGQPFCLECGRRLARDYRRPPNWRVPVALIALLVTAAGIAAGYGITQLTNTDTPAKDITVTTGPGGTTQADPGEAPTTPAPAAPAPPAPAPAAPQATTPNTPAAPSGPTAWPAGKKAYTVVLLTTKNKDTADQTAEKASKGGQQAGVFKSDDFKRFSPGLYVVFSGQYDDVDAASQQAQQLGADNPGAYARFVEPK